ncbi:hypothetical protein ABDI30_21590 [Paenibacillus cisolokensis]|uniref:hypothetical protein n=1 Tax=Paenibacillus cisolokensis TaxID=1658519 RepID=UPI003D2AAA18
MDNKLTLHYDRNVWDREELKNYVKGALEDRYRFEESEFDTITDGFKFLYDDETNGEIVVTFSEGKDSVKVSVEGSWPWEVLEIYDHCLPQSAEHDPA